MPPRSQPPSRSGPPGGKRPPPPSGSPRPPAQPERGRVPQGRPAGQRPAPPVAARPRPMPRPEARPAPRPAPRPARVARQVELEPELDAMSSGVDELTEDCFNAIIALRHIDDGAAQDPERVQKHFRKLITRMIQDAPRLRVPHDDAQEMAYAIAALADEVALNGSPTLSQYWMGNLLQMHFFDENAAGEGFFEHLDAARAARRYLKVYYLCLMLGFVGRYAMHGGEAELADLAASIRDTLRRGGISEPETLSPNGERPKEALTKPQKTLQLIWIPAGAIAAAAILYVVLAATVAHRASALVTFLGTLVR